MSQTNLLRAIVNNKEVLGSAEIRHVASHGAILRAAKAFFLALIGGIIVLPIPLVHIFGAILIVGSPIAAIVVFFKSRGMVEGMSGRFHCPDCKADNIVEYQEGKPPYYGSCAGCRNPYQVFPVEAP